MGLRAGAGPDLDVLIFGSEADAAEAVDRLRDEARGDVSRHEAFVVLTVRADAGEVPRHVQRALDACMDEATN